MHRRNLPARERIETDEEVAKREDEDYRQKKMENPDKARAPTHDQVYIYIYIYIYICNINVVICGARHDQMMS